ncbi:ankyrin repeat domain-containing protein [Deltaproteobacteria bacterium TL4]
MDQPQFFELDFEGATVLSYPLLSMEIIMFKTQILIKHLTSWGLGCLIFTLIACGGTAQTSTPDTKNITHAKTTTTVAIKPQPASQVQRQPEKQAVVNPDGLSQEKLNIKLYGAAKRGHLEKIKYWIAAGAEINQNDIPPLFVAADQGQTKAVQLLLSEGAQTDLPTILVNEYVKKVEGFTPLMTASHKGYTEIVKLLIDAGANVNARTQSEDFLGNDTALIRAVSKGHTEIVRLLLDAGADPNVQSNDKTSALSMASSEGYTDIVKLLLDHQVNVNIQTKYGTTPVMWASKRGHTEIAQLLVNHEAQLNYQEKGDLVNGDTALMDASKRGYVEIVRILVQNGADINIRNKKGETALKLAKAYEEWETVKVLQQAGAEE